ncbi:MAG: hypothetical protein WBM41_05225 [Arenicellales bacterium]
MDIQFQPDLATRRIFRYLGSEVDDAVELAEQTEVLYSHRHRLR